MGRFAHKGRWFKLSQSLRNTVQCLCISKFKKVFECHVVSYKRKRPGLFWLLQTPYWLLCKLNISGWLPLKLLTNLPQYKKPKKFKFWFDLFTKLNLQITALTKKSTKLQLAKEIYNTKWFWLFSASLLYTNKIVYLDAKNMSCFIWHLMQNYGQNSASKSISSSIFEFKCLFYQFFFLNDEENGEFQSSTWNWERCYVSRTL